MKSATKRKSISMDLGDLIEEHERLTKLLHSLINHITVELIDQEKELKKYKKMGGITKKVPLKNYNKVRIVMREFKKGNLFDSHGKKVTNAKQAIAIAINEQKRYDKKKNVY